MIKRIIAIGSGKGGVGKSTLSVNLSIVLSKYPKYNESYLLDSTKTYPVSINGKLRYKIELPTDLNKEEIEKEILSDKDFIKKLDGKKPKRIIIVPGKIINFVI